MSQPFPFIIQGNNITVVIGSTPFTISKSHITYPQVLEAIKAGDWERVKEIVDPVKVVLKFGQGNVSIEGEQLSWKGKPLHSSLATRMISMLQEGFDVKPMANFMENLFSNPSKRAVDELYSFLEKNNLPITPCGSFLAYKRVRHNYTDCHTGTMDNSVGQVVEMERNEVDDNKDRTCSAGLHFCSHSYLGHFGGDRVVIVKINPRDVVSIPSDYNDAKGRACRYEVIGEVGNNPDDGVEFTRPVQTNANSVQTPDTWNWDADGVDEFDDMVDDSYDYDADGDEDLVELDITTEPKRGSGMFFRGYDDGYAGRKFDPQAQTPTGGRFYTDGYEKGADDRDWGLPPAYVYVPGTPSGWTRHPDGKVSPPSGTVFTAQTADVKASAPAAWPFPKGDK
jgi:hypothetical protein